MRNVVFLSLAAAGGAALTFVVAVSQGSEALLLILGCATAIFIDWRTSERGRMSLPGILAAAVVGSTLGSVAGLAALLLGVAAGEASWAKNGSAVRVRTVASYIVLSTAAVTVMYLPKVAWDTQTWGAVEWAWYWVWVAAVATAWIAAVSVNRGGAGVKTTFFESDTVEDSRNLVDLGVNAASAVIVATFAVGVQALLVHTNSTFILAALGAAFPIAVAAQYALASERLRGEHALTEAALRRRQEWLTSLVDRQDEARQVMVAELHDEPLQDIIAAATLLDMYQRGADVSLPQQAHELLIKAVEGIRAVMSSTGETPQVSVNLSAALSQLAHDTDVGVTVNIDEHAADGVSLQQARSIYLVAREALTNVVKHSAATNAQLGLTRTEDNVVLTVRDDGVGASQEVLAFASEPGHLGVMLMAARAALIGGELEIHAPSGGGTLVKLKVPLTQPQ